MPIKSYRKFPLRNFLYDIKILSQKPRKINTNQLIICFLNSNIFDGATDNSSTPASMITNYIINKLDVKYFYSE